MCLKAILRFHTEARPGLIRRAGGCARGKCIRFDPIRFESIRFESIGSESIRFDSIRSAGCAHGNCARRINPGRAISLRLLYSSRQLLSKASIYYNSGTAAWVLSSRRYSKNAPRASKITTGGLRGNCEQSRVNVWVGDFYLVFYWFFIDFRRLLWVRERSWLLISTRHSGALGQRSGRDLAPAAARRRRPPEGGRAQGRAEVLNPPKCFVL